MYRMIVNEVVSILRRRGNFTLDDVKDFLGVAMDVTDDRCHWTDDDYNNMFDDIMAALHHPGAMFVE